MTLAKAVTRTLDVDVDDVRIDLTATIKSYDLTDTKFIFDIQSSQGLTINLIGGTAMFIVEYVHNSQTYAIQGNIDIINSTKISFNLPSDLKGYKGTVLIGLYVQMADGTKIDIKDIAVRIEPSIMDKGIDFSARTYFEDFETVKAEITLKGEQAKTAINAVVADVSTYGNSQKQAIDSVVTDVQSTGETAKTQINQVLPSVQSQVSELGRQIEALPQIPDLFVAYGDDLAGSGFSKTDSSKLFKGYGVKNSTNATDYRWERNPDNIKIGGRNLLKDTANFGANGRIGSAKDGWLNYYDSDVETEKYNGLTVRSLKNVTTVKEMCDYYLTGFNLGDTYTFSFWAKGTINTLNCYFYGDSGYVKAKVVNASISYTAYDLFDNGAITFVNPNITDWTRISIVWKLDSVGDINIAKKILIRADGATGGDLYVCGVKLEKGNIATDHSPAPEDLILNSNPINSILTTLSQENPSTTLGGTWVQLGNETKFNNTIYYWKRTQ